jgi:putative sigma-54 modulation protein
MGPPAARLFPKESTVEIVVTGRHGVLSEMRDYAEMKLGRLENVFGRLFSAKVILESNGAVHRAEAQVTAPRGAKLVARVEADEMRKALDKLEARLEAQARKLKTKIEGRRRSGAGRGAA